MKKIVFLILYFLQVGFVKCQIKLDARLDSMINQNVKFVSKINDSISSIMIFYSPYEAKGFLVDDNIPGFWNGNKRPDSILKCSDTCNIRFLATPLSGDMVEIKFKWRDSLDFIVDTFYVYAFKQKYMAYTTKFYNKNIDAVRNTMDFWALGPASTDEREVVRICKLSKDRVAFYSER